MGLPWFDGHRVWGAKQKAPMKTLLRKPAATTPASLQTKALEHWRKTGRSAAKVAAGLGIRPVTYKT